MCLLFSLPEGLAEKKRAFVHKHACSLTWKHENGMRRGEFSDCKFCAISADGGVSFSS
jgi:hypothetical protein